MENHISICGDACLILDIIVIKGKDKMSHILCYCEKCGQRTYTFDDNINNLKDRKCSGCLETGHIKPIPEKYISYIGGGTVPIYNEDLRIF